MLPFDPVVAGYDAVYTGLATSPTLGRIWREHALGPDYPTGFEHLSFLTFAELRGVATALSGEPRGTLVDLGCGGGGPGLWTVKQSKGRLIGIDASAVGLAAARERARRCGLAQVSRFLQARFEHVAIRSESAEAVMSVDALQYSTSKRAAFLEVARVLRPAGRFVFAAFEVNPSAVAGLPILGVDPVSDFRPMLEAAGFDVESYDESLSWERRVRDTYAAVRVALPRLSIELGDRAATALGFEVSLTLQRAIYRRRVIVAAVRRG
jgi:SAM-dependent methyltransferase